MSEERGDIQYFALGKEFPEGFIRSLESPALGGTLHFNTPIDVLVSYVGHWDDIYQKWRDTVSEYPQVASFAYLPDDNNERIYHPEFRVISEDGKLSKKSFKWWPVDKGRFVVHLSDRGEVDLEELDRFKTQFLPAYSLILQLMQGD